MTVPTYIIHRPLPPLAGQEEGQSEGTSFLHTHCRHVKPAEERPHVSCSETNPNTQPEWAMKSSQGSSEGGPPCSVSTERPQPLPVLPSYPPSTCKPTLPRDALRPDTTERGITPFTESINKAQGLPESCGQVRASDNRPRTLLRALGSPATGVQAQGHHQRGPFKQAPT